MRLSLAALGLLLASLAHAAAPPARPHSTIDAFGDALPAGAIARIGTSRFRFDGVVYEIAFAPDGKLAVLHSNISGRAVKAVIDTTTGRTVSTLVNSSTDIWMVVSRDGKQLFTSDYKSILVLDLRQGKQERAIALPFQQGHRYAVSGNERVVAASSFSRANAELIVCDLKTGKQLAKMEALHGTDLGLTLSHDGKWLANHGGGRGLRGNVERIAKTVQIWDTAAGKEARRIESDAAVTETAFSPDGKLLALASAETIQVYEVVTGKRLQSWRAPKRTHYGGLGMAGSRRTSFTFSPDGKHLVLGVRNSLEPPAVWESATGRAVELGPMPPCRFVDVGFDKGRIVALGIQGQTLFAWDLLQGQADDQSLPTWPVNALAWRGDRIVHYSGRRGSVWNTVGQRLALYPVLKSTRDPNFVSRESRAALSPGGESVASALLFGQGELKVRDLGVAEARITLDQEGEDMIAPAFSPDGKHVALPNNTSRVRVLLTETGKEVLTFDGGKSTPTGLAFDPTGKRLAIALMPEEEQGSLVVWRVDQNKEDAGFEKVNLPPLAGRRRRDQLIHSPLVFSADGALLARVVLDDFRQAVHLYDGFNGKDRGRLPVPRMVTTAPAFSPDGRSLAVASGGYTLDHYISLWEIRTGQVRWYAALPSTPTALAFGPSGKFLVTGHRDSSALVWDVTGHYATGKVRPAPDHADLWKTLASEDAEKAFAAQRSLAADRDRAVSALQKRLNPAAGKSLPEATLTRLVQQLDDDEYAVRAKARTTLVEQGRAAEPALQKALVGKPSVERKRAVLLLLARLDRMKATGDELAALRALEVLEWIGTPEARKVVEVLARGWAGANLTREAKATLVRWPK